MPCSVCAAPKRSALVHPAALGGHCGDQFRSSRLGETPAQFKQRMQKVEDFMNSDALAADDGGRGLRGLATEMLEMCKEVVKRQGERIPK